MSKQRNSEYSLGSLNLDGLSAEAFLQNYWQKKPLLVPQAFEGLTSPVSAAELAGLACEDNINSRLVLANEQDAEEHRWQVEFGPFEESRFTSLPKSGWSLLVSDVERHLPETHYLLDAFRFIPDWRVDDLMISYAPEGGSVGAHTDAYDVFLIQLSGKRRWMISEMFDETTLEGTDLSILKNFDAESEWTLSAGDMLYLPPNVAHHGIALADKADCMTASVGFRAPSLKTISTDYVHFLNEEDTESRRYQDAAPKPPEHHAEISDESVERFVDYLKQGISFDHDKVRYWLGRYSSDNKAFEDIAHETIDNVHHQDIDTLLDSTQRHGLMQSPYSRFLFSRSSEGGKAILFVDGEDHDVSLAFAQSLCDEREFDLNSLRRLMTESDQQVLLLLFNNGSIVEMR